MKRLVRLLWKDITGVDTNLLTRVVLEDDESQAKEARDFLAKYAKKRQIFVSSYVILEFAWVLRTRGRSKQEIYDAITTIVDSSNMVIGQRSVVVKALAKYKSGKADFADYMIIAEGEENGVYKIKTFDKKLHREFGIVEL